MLRLFVLAVVLCGRFFFFGPITGVPTCLRVHRGYRAGRYSAYCLSWGSLTDSCTARAADFAHFGGSYPPVRCFTSSSKSRRQCGQMFKSSPPRTSLPHSQMST